MTEPYRLVRAGFSGQPAVGTAVALHPLTRRRSPALALGFVASRTIEAGLVLLGVIAMLALSGWAARPRPRGRRWSRLHDWAFLIGRGTLPAINALLLAPALLRARLAPRAIVLIGLIGAPVLLVAAAAELLGRLDQVSLWGGLAALPIAAWELSLGLWLALRGIPETATPSVAPRPATVLRGGTAGADRPNAG